MTGKDELDSPTKELKSGKFEPLVHMNGLLRQEVTRVITSGEWSFVWKSYLHG